MRYFLTAFFLPLLLCSTFAQTNFKINGNIKNIPGVKDVLKDGDTVILSFSALHLSFPGIIKNNAFSINENIIEPAVAMLEFKGSAVKLLVDNSIYNVEIVNKEVRKGFYTYEGSVTTNSEFHNGWYKFAQSIFALYNQKTKLVNELDSVKNDIAKQNVNQKIVALDTLINFSYKKLAQTQPNNPASAYLMGSAPDFSYTNYIDAYKNLSFKVRNGFFGKALYTRLNMVKNLKTEKEIGVVDSKKIKLPSTNVIDTLGKSARLDLNFFKQSKYTLIEFWASWCAPCRLINIDLRAKEQEYSSKGLQIIGFSLDQDAIGWKNAIVADKIKWPNYSDLKATHSPLAKFLNLTEIPANVLVNSDGIIVARNVYGTDLEKIIFE